MPKTKQDIKAAVLESLHRDLAVETNALKALRHKVARLRTHIKQVASTKIRKVPSSKCGLPNPAYRALLKRGVGCQFLVWNDRDTVSLPGVATWDPADGWHGSAGSRSIGPIEAVALLAEAP